MRRLALILAVLCPVAGWAQNTGADAFAQRDFATARQIWQQEADAGSAEAMLGLGLLADRGFGGQRDFDLAYAWYAKAAERGLAEAQFNIAIMYDAGLGRPRDVQQALIWYTRAALRDHARAQYNLGLLLESGDGVPANPVFAAYWFEKAAQSVPAAAERTIPPQVSFDALQSPLLSFAQATVEGAEMVWTAPNPATTRYLVELLEVPGTDQDYAAPLLSQTTVASGFLEPVTVPSENTLWRVSAIGADGQDYAPSNWIGSDQIGGPKGRITFVVDPEVPAMVQAAGVFADDLREAGYWVRTDQGGKPGLGAEYVSYGFASDQLLADVIASYLPRPAAPAPAPQMSQATQPGEIIVNFAVLGPDR